MTTRKHQPSVFDTLNAAADATASKRARIEREAAGASTRRRKVVMSLSVDPALKSRLVRAAAAETARRGVSVSASALAGRIIAEWLDAHGEG